MTNRERFPNLSDELIAIFDDYDAKVASGELWIVNGHAVNTNSPGQIWATFVNSKVSGIYNA